jgi:hypothetical protein
MIGKAGQVGHPLLCKLRNLLVKITPTGTMQKNIHQAAGFDVLVDT